MTTINTPKLRQALERHAELSENKLHTHNIRTLSNGSKKRGIHSKHIRHHAV